MRIPLSMTLTVLALIACSDHPPAQASVAPAAENALFGTWRGTSVCTPVRPACRDEIAVDHIAPSSKPETVLMTMNKVVNGEEVEMGGTVEFHVDAAAHTLTWEMAARDGTRGEFRFTWSGNHMTGTLVQLPGGEVVRNITLDKQ